MAVLSDQLRRITDLAVGLAGVRDYLDVGRLGAEALDDLVASDGANVTFTPVPLPQRVFTTGRMPWAHPQDTQYRPAFAHEDPVYQRRLRRLIDRPAHVNEFATSREIERTALYHEVWKPQGIRSHLSAMNPCKYWFSLAMTRGGITPFTSEDVAVVDSVRRLMESAIDGLVRQHDYRIPVGGELYEVQSNHWLVCDATGKILRADTRALLYLDELNPEMGVHRVGGRLPERYVRVFRQRLAGGPREPLSQLTSMETVTVHVAPIHGCESEFSVFFVAQRRRDVVVEVATAAAEGGTRGTASAAGAVGAGSAAGIRGVGMGGAGLRDLPGGGVQRRLGPSEAASLSAARLRRAGLTPKEIEVLEWLRQGKTNPEVAIILGSSPLTVKKHVEHVFRKLRVETRVAAVMRALELSVEAGAEGAGLS